LYEIILNIIKSASIRLIELKNYTDEFIPQENSILKLFNNLNFTTMSEEKLTKKINDFAKVNYEIHQKLHQQKEKHYGQITLNNVQVGAKKGKSILVSGQNLKDFENLLEALKDTDINVYTHNGLVVAHAYPKFLEYKNLVGHFQMSLDSLQFDFSTFKGPILIVRNFQFLLDKLYRGRLFTTNIVAGKSMTKIENQDFSQIISEAEISEGYQNDHKYAKIKVGYNETEIFKKIDFLIKKIQKKEIKHLLIVGLFNHAVLHSEYLKQLEENLPDEYFLISTLVPSDKANVLYFNSFFNSSLIYKIIAYIKEKIDFDIFSVSLFITTCNLHTLSHIFNMKYLGIKNIFLPECTSNVITPSMLNFLKNKFGLKQISSNPLHDLKMLE
jgi:hydroxylamine reductase (hybrid-cluster protein)